MSFIRFSMTRDDEPDFTSYTISQLVKTKKPYGWEKVFEEGQMELNNIGEILDRIEHMNGIRCFPARNDIFKAFDLTALSDVKVVVVGQDPYHDTYFNGIPRAQGLSFSSPRGAPIPPSLKTIYKELNRMNPDYIHPTHGDLEYWAQQGVLMLNMCLTVDPGKPNSHKKIWYEFLNVVCKAINIANPNCIYLCWGKKSQDIAQMAGSKSIILTAGHPSPLNRNNDFVGCDHFNIANQLLISNGRNPIDWFIPEQ
ncbi:Uracil-DNA glycosylase [compost metagenome]